MKKAIPNSVEIRAVCAFTGLQTGEDESGFFSPFVTSLTWLPALCKCTGRQDFFFFNACMRIKVKPLVSAMQQTLPSSCSRRAYPQPRDALIETCCQSDKHICIQSTLYLFSLERSTVCCWLNILNQFAVSELPASSLVLAPSSLGDRLAAGGGGLSQGNHRPLSFNSFQLCPHGTSSLSLFPGPWFDGLLTVTSTVSRAPTAGRNEF